MENKQEELIKYKNLVLATIDYQLQLYEKFPQPAFELTNNFEQLKAQTNTHFNKGSLGTLKRWFKDLSEPMVDTKDLRFSSYLEEKTGYKIDLFKKQIERIEKIIQKGMITTDNQYREVDSFVDNLCQSNPQDIERINLLNNLLVNYHKQKAAKTKAGK